jgi:hypothetical protein
MSINPGVRLSNGFRTSVMRIASDLPQTTICLPILNVNLETHYNFNNDKNLSSTKLLLDLTTDYKMDNGFKVNSNLKAYHDFIFYASNNYANF